MFSISSTIDRSFGEGGHRGTDFARPAGTSIPAIADGVVGSRGTGSVFGYNYGNWLILSHGDGMSSFYAHMSQPALVSGGSVTRGQTIGTVGKTGGTTAEPVIGNHLHLGMMPTNTSNFFNAVPYIQARLAAPSVSNPSPVTPPFEIEEDNVFIQAISNGNSGYAVNGYIYANDIGGHWRGLTNLEGTGYVIPLSNQGRVNLLQFYGSDIELLFAVNGLWEQVPLGASAPTWSSGQQLIGLGNLTGRLIYPGASGLQGTWHYPADEHA
jgi:hypothetical protein